MREVKLKGVNLFMSQFKNTFEFEFKDIKWGEDEAKDDENLDNYFVEFPEFNDIISGYKRYIIGRKGTGKSAILQKIRLMANEDPLLFFEDISLRDFPFADFKIMEDKSLANKSKYIVAWKILLLLSYIKMMLADESIMNYRAKDELREFIEENFPNGISIPETIRQIKDNNNKLSVKMLPFLSGETANKRSVTLDGKVHFNALEKELELILQKAKSNESTYFLLIDELDEGYKRENERQNSVIMSLLRATEEISRFFRSNSIKCYPILALREDIFDSLEDNDLNKLDDYILRLNWSAEDGGAWSLKNIVEKRIGASIKSKYGNLISSLDYWGLVTEENNTGKDLWSYICALTFCRPRDIVKIMKYCKNTKGRLTLDDIHAIENNYSQWLYNEFRDEVQSFLSCWKNVLNCLTEIAEGKAEIDLLKERLENDEIVKNWCENNKKNADYIINLLFNYSVIGQVNKKGHWIFKYKDNAIEYMSSYPYYCVHYGFCRKLRIPKKYDKTIVNVLTNSD